MTTNPKTSLEAAGNAAGAVGGAVQEAAGNAVAADAGAVQEAAKLAMAVQEATKLATSIPESEAAIEAAEAAVDQCALDIRAFADAAERRTLVEEIYEAARLLLRNNKYAVLAFDRAVDASINERLKHLGANVVVDAHAALAAATASIAARADAKR